MDTGKSALGLDGNVAAALGYPIGIIAIISLVMEKENRFVKFHAIQSLLYHAAAIIVFVVLVIVLTILTIVLALISSALGALSSLLWLLYMIVFLAYLIGLIYAAVKAYNGDKFVLPVIGGMADKWTGN
jgi:uncharacterized membrane protein